MLIEFRIKNFRSFRDSQTLSLVRTKGKELESTHTFEASPSVRLVKTAALYGPNAGGKTNLLHAIGIMKTIVLRSAANFTGVIGYPSHRSGWMTKPQVCLPSLR